MDIGGETGRDKTTPPLYGARSVNKVECYTAHPSYSTCSPTVSCLLVTTTDCQFGSFRELTLYHSQDTLILIGAYSLHLLVVVNTRADTGDFRQHKYN